ncbi:hypothetical protein K1719_009702 [Acacia pycnantha]|nr:hypothetical protein K1719_009702 [Acacia pycnantha]
MCHPGAPFVGARWVVVQEIVAVVDTAAAGGAGEGGTMRRCVCSPSQHPGSFRCRHHHAQYVWPGRRIIN